MEALNEYLIPFLVSNLVFGLTIVAALRKPMYARMFLAAFFLWATCINSTLAIRSPEVYLDYARLDAVPVYRDFINGFFSSHITPLVISIAAGQLFITIGLILNKTWTQLACFGGIVFGLAIAPLGVGSAFPSTVSMAIAFYILMRKYDHDYIWNWKQYKNQHCSKMVAHHG
jgi:hypothetical protein